MRIVVVGGGILGLATARLICHSDPAAEVTVLEKELAVATHQTGHNSGVAHAGLYYAPGSLKARLCRRGIGLLRDYCRDHGLRYDACGKLVIATTAEELPRLHALAERAGQNGVPGLRWLDGGAIQQVEPHAQGVAALHSPETAILDFGSVARAMAAEVVGFGGQIQLGARVRRIVPAAHGGALVVCDGGDQIRAERVVVCAGLHADRLARASGQPAAPRIVPFRGEYWQLRPGRTDLVRGLVYPVPDPAMPFLGVHLTRRIDGSVWIGPNAILALAREGYERRRVAPRDVIDTLSWPGTYRMMRRHWRAGIDELWRSARMRAFVQDARRYVPGLSPADVIRAPAGVRAQAVDRDGALVDDFRLSIAGGVAWVRNAPSPAATSSLAIAEELVERTLGRTSIEAAT
jgi:L-2-hydroxyglutarate oxidase LhgO